MWNKLQQKPLTAASSAWQVLLFQLLLRVDCNLFTSLSSGSFQLHYSMLVRLQLFIDISMAQLLCMIERPPTIVQRRKPLFLFLNNEQTQRSTQISKRIIEESRLRIRFTWSVFNFPLLPERLFKMEQGNSLFSRILRSICDLWELWIFFLFQCHSFFSSFTIFCQLIHPQSHILTDGIM